MSVVLQAPPIPKRPASAAAAAAADADPPLEMSPLKALQDASAPVEASPATLTLAEQQALWAEVGLETNGVHNYDPACLDLPPSELRALHDEFAAHQRLFGFQADNVRNQMEHLCFLLQNARDRYGKEGDHYLHNRLFSNYRRWCEHINAQRWCFQKRMKHAFDSPAYGARNRLQDLVLWLLIWGEAANLRACGEFLCFVFYRMSLERQRVIDSGSIDRDHTTDEWFRCHVVEPAYGIVIGMQQYSRNNGTLKDHPKRPNYDDVNEYFWNRRWLDHNKNYHDEDTTRFWGLRYTRDHLLDRDPKTGRVTAPQKEGSAEDADRKDAARRRLKTFPEKRSWMNLFRSFFRIVELHLFALHLLILFGYDYPQSGNWHQTATCVLTPAGLAVLLEIVEFGFYWGVIRAQGLLVNFILRLAVYSGVFLVLLYVYLANIYFLWFAVGYLSIRVVWELANVSTHRWMRKWHMSEDRNFESEVSTQLGVRRRIGATIYWIAIFMLKCFYSYYTYIRSIIDLTSTLLDIPGWVGAAGIGPDNSSSLSNWVLVVLLWFPTITMFLIDTQIFFSITNVVLGVIIGVRDRVCNVRDWNDVERSFIASWRSGARKMFAKDQTVQIGVEAPSDAHRGPLNLPPLVSPPWHLIQVVWREVVAKMRAADHVSYRDEQMLHFGHFTFRTAASVSGGAGDAASFVKKEEIAESFFLPPFVTAGQIQTFLEMLGELQDSRDRRLGGQSMLLREVRRQLLENETMRTALDEIYTAGTLLLQTFIPRGPVHFDLSTGGNRLLEYTCRQKKPHSFLKDVTKCLEQVAVEGIAYCFDKGHQNVIRKPPTVATITATQADTVSDASKVPEQANSKAFEGHLRQLYKFWTLISEAPESESAASGSADASAAIASNVAPPPIDLSSVDHMATNEIGSLLRTVFHLLSTPNVDARPQNRSVSDRLMFFLSSLNMRLPDRQNSAREMYSWTVLTPYVEELVIYTPEELEMPNAEGITADFYLKTTHRKEWLYFLERLASDPLGGDPNYRLLQKREWCSYRGQTLLRTVRGMMYYEYATKLLMLLELARGSHWTPAQELTAKRIAQRKFQYVVSAQKFGAFRQARARRDRGELIDKPNLPDGVRAERRRLLDEAQKCDDIEYILRKYPHLRIAYVDDSTIAGERVFASVLIKAVVPREADGQPLPPEVVLGLKGGRRDALLARAQAEKNRGDGIHAAGAAADALDDIDADKAGMAQSKADQQLVVPQQPAAGDIQEIYRVRLPGTVLVGEGKPENQNHAIIFTRGELLEAIDMNQDNYLEESLKMRNLLEEFDPLRADDDPKDPRDEIDRPSVIATDPKTARQSGILKCAILGFRENIFTVGLMSVGTYMSLMEATFVSMTMRTFAWLGTRQHYGHPDCLDKLFFITRGGMSKSSKMLHVSEDIFAGFKATLRGGRVFHKEYIQCGKGRDLGFNQLFLFEAKLASGAGEQALSREAYRLGHYLDLPRLLSFFYGSIGFYASTALIVVSIATLLFANMMVALTGVDKRVNEFNSQFGTSVNLLHASSVYQLGFLLIFPMLSEIALEKTLMKALTTLIWLIVTGGPFFFFFHTQTKAFFFNNSTMFGGAKYRATGRGFVLSRESFTRVYRTYARTHIYPAMKMLFMMVVYGIFGHPEDNWFVEMWAPLLLVIAWLYAPMWFNPMVFDHEAVLNDFQEWQRWLDRRAPDEEKSWQGWWVAETEYLNRTPFSTKAWLTAFNIVIPVAIIAASISSLEATSFSRVYFLIVSVGVTVGLVAVSLFLVNQFHPVGDTYRWLKFLFGSLILALLIVTIIFDSGSSTVGWKGTNFAVYLIVIALTFNAICKVLMLHGAGPYRFGFCLTWFRYCDTIFGAIVYAPWLIFSFIGLAAIQTRLLYNRAFHQGLRVSELLRGDPTRKDNYQHRTAVVINRKFGAGFTPANAQQLKREGSDGELAVRVPSPSRGVSDDQDPKLGGGGGGGSGVGVHSRSAHMHQLSVPMERSRNAPPARSPSFSHTTSTRRGSLASQESSSFGRDEPAGPPPSSHVTAGHHGGPLYSHSPSNGAGAAGAPSAPSAPAPAPRPSPLSLNPSPTPTAGTRLLSLSTGSAHAYALSTRAAALASQNEEKQQPVQPRYTYD